MTNHPVSPVTTRRTGKRGLWKWILLAVVAAVVALCALFLVTHHSRYETSLNGNGTCTITGWCGYASEIDIPDTIDGEKVTVIGPSAFSSNPLRGIIDEFGIYIERVSIPWGVTMICEDAFSFTRISSMVIPDGVTYIGDWAFAYCRYLLSIYLPASVTVIEDSAFLGCDNVTFYVPRGSYAATWAQEHGFDCQYVD